MKNALIIFTLLLAAVLTIAQAQEVRNILIREGGQAGDGPTMRLPASNPYRRAGGAGGETYSSYETMFKVVEATPAQQQKIRDLETARAKAIAQWQSDNAEALAKVREALQQASKSGDREAVVKAMRENQELTAPLAELMKKSMVDIMDVLTPEQKDAWQEYNVLNSISSWYGAAKLTQEQQDKIKEAYRELRKDPKLDQMALLSKLSQQVPDMLTDEQKHALKSGWGAITSSPAGGSPRPGAPVQTTSVPSGWIRAERPMAGGSASPGGN